MCQDYYSHKLHVESLQFYAQWEQSHAAWKKAKEHARWAKKNQISESFEAMHVSGLCSAKTKDEIDRVFDTLPGVA